jgi:hypothetical protein
MTKETTLPVQGKAIRFAPGRDNEPAASFWKIWAEGSEVYASSRGPGGSAKISVHASGQIHYRLEGKLKQDMAPLMQLGSGQWLHAFELRFLLSDSANLPFRERESLKNKSAHLLPVPGGFLLHANLIVGSMGTPYDSPLPAELLPAGQALWQTRLRDGRPAVLVARMLEMDTNNRDHIQHLRDELKPTVTFSAMPSGRKYVEVLHLHWSAEGGNVVLVVPMGDEAFRSDDVGSPQDASAETLAPRLFRFSCTRSSVQIVAPNGSPVAIIELDLADTALELAKGQPATFDLGVLSIRIEPRNLIPGSPFIASPCRLVCSPSIDAASPRTWEYMILPRFNGFELTSELRPLSVSLQNKNLSTALKQLGGREELLMTIPKVALALSATLDAPTASARVLGGFTLRDTR